MDGCLKEAKKGPIKLVKYLKNLIFAIVEGKIFYILNCMLKLLLSVVKFRSKD